MDQKIIPIRIRDEHIIGAGVTVGAQGSGGDVVFQMEFGPMWDDLVKYVTFRDALGENPVVTLLTTNMIERLEGEAPPDHPDRPAGDRPCPPPAPRGQAEGPCRPAGEKGSCPGCGCTSGPEGPATCRIVYNVPIPAKAKAVSGKMMVTVHGYSLNEDGTQVETATMAATAYFRVLPAAWSMPEDEGFEDPTLAQQMQAQIEDIRRDIVDAAKAADAKEFAQEKAQAAAQSAQEAQAAQAGAEQARDQARAAAATAAQGAAEAVKAAKTELTGYVTQAKNAAQSAQAAQKAAEAAENGAQTALESVRHCEKTISIKLDTTLTHADRAEKAQAAAEAARDQTVAEKDYMIGKANEVLLAAAGHSRDADAAKREAMEQAELAQARARSASAALDAAKAAVRQAERAKEEAQVHSISAFQNFQDTQQVAEQAEATVEKAAESAVEEATVQADRAKFEADRAQAIAGGDFVTPPVLKAALAEKAALPMIGQAALIEQLEPGGVLFITEGELPEGAVMESDLDHSWNESY